MPSGASGSRHTCADHGAGPPAAASSTTPIPMSDPTAGGTSAKPAAAFPYATHLDVRFPPLETIALDPLVASVRDRWYNQTLARVNDSVVRLGVMQGEYHWHRHADDDEFFYVVEGTFLIDLE